MKSKIGILGSSSSTDPFKEEFNENAIHYDVLFNVEKTSFISLMQTPISYEEDSITIEPYTRENERSVKNIEDDLSKKFFDYISDEEIEYLIIDVFNDAFYGIIETDDYIFTNNLDDYKKTSFYNNLSNPKTISLSNDYDKYFELWKDSCNKFFDFMTNNYSNVRIILNKLEICKSVTRKDGSDYVDEKFSKLAETFNPFLEKLEEYIENNFDIDIIHFDSDNSINEVHVNGKNVDSYCEHYYFSFDHQLKDAIHNNLLRLYEEERNMLEKTKEVMGRIKPEYLITLLKYNKAIFEIRPLDENSSFEILDVSDNDVQITNKEGTYTIESVKNFIRFNIHGFKSGAVNIVMKAVEPLNTKEIPIQCTSFKINKKQQIKEDKILTFNENFETTINFEENEDIEIVSRWIPLNQEEYLSKKDIIKQEDEMGGKNTARFFIKNYGKLNGVLIYENSDEKSTIDYPTWFKDERGSGLVLTSSEGNIDFKIRGIQDGKLKILLRSIYPLKNHEEPAQIHFTHFQVNDKIIISKKQLVTRLKPYLFEKDIKSGESVSIKAEWKITPKKQNDNIARFDIKNNGTPENTILLTQNTDKDANTEYPDWYQDENGKGLILTSSKGKIDFNIKCIKDGTLKLFIHNIYPLKNKEKQNHLTFTKLIINNQTIINNPKKPKHRKTYQQTVKDGEIINIKAEWKKTFTKEDKKEKTSPQQKIQSPKKQAPKIKQKNTTSTTEPPKKQEIIPIPGALNPQLEQFHYKNPENTMKKNLYQLSTEEETEEKPNKIKEEKPVEEDTAKIIEPVEKVVDKDKKDVTVQDEQTDDSIKSKIFTIIKEELREIDEEEQTDSKQTPKEPNKTKTQKTTQKQEQEQIDKKPSKTKKEQNINNKEKKDKIKTDKQNKKTSIVSSITSILKDEEETEEKTQQNKNTKETETKENIDKHETSELKNKKETFSTPDLSLILEDEEETENSEKIDENKEKELDENNKKESKVSKSKFNNILKEIK